MEEQAKTDKHTNDIFLWLTTWCGFKDWHHIIKLFDILRLKAFEFEDDIKERTLRKLKEVFMESKIEIVQSLILSYIDSNSTYSGAFKPRHLLGELQDYIRPEFERWSMFKTNGRWWTISGTHDLEKNEEIEKPTVVISKLWNNSCATVNSIKICGNYSDDCMLNSLMRLSLHFLGNNPFCSNKTKWENSLENKTGKTLGISENDFDTLMILSLSDDTYSVSESRNLNLIDEIEDYASQLNDEMYKITFNNVDDDISKKIKDMSKSNLRSEIESRWNDWKNELKDDTGRQRELFSKILRPNAEGEIISAEIRSGLKTVKLLSRAIFMLLILSVCLNEGKNKGFDVVTDELRMKAIGLAYWSGPSDCSRKVVRIDYHKHMYKLLANETEEIIVLSNSNVSANNLLEDSLTGEAEQVGLLTECKRPKLLITYDSYFERLVEKGDISCLSRHLKEKIYTYDKCITDSIKNVAGGV